MQTRIVVRENGNGDKEYKGQVKSLFWWDIPLIHSGSGCNFYWGKLSMVKEVIDRKIEREEDRKNKRWKWKIVDYIKYP